MFKTHRTYSLSTGVKGNTLAVVDCGGSTCVVYHKTVVLQKKGSTIILRNGGWDSVSTRIVINRALAQIPEADLGGQNGRIHISREKGVTKVWMGQERGYIDFVSGMKIRRKAAGKALGVLS